MAQNKIYSYHEKHDYSSSVPLILRSLASYAKMRTDPDFAQPAIGFRTPEDPGATGFTAQISCVDVGHTSSMETSVGP